MFTRDEVFTMLTGKLAELLAADASTLHEDTEFSALSMSSRLFVQLLTYLEEETDADLPFMKFKRCKTLGAACDFIMEQI